MNKPTENNGEWYKLLIEKIRAAVVIHDSSTKIILSNPAAQQLLSLSENQLMGKTAMDPDWYFLRENGTRMPIEEYPVNKIMSTRQPLSNYVVGIHHGVNKDNTWALVFGDPVFDQNGEIQETIITFIDISDSISNNAINESRLHLIQFSETNSLDDLLEETLNECEKLTDSLIGFYHFVEDDQINLTLQYWSKRTKKTFFKEEGKGIHSPIDQAGVWDDCVLQKKPVVHNNYASLSNKKGMPEGHATVIRELVVPVLRNGKVKAILGVGNKPVDYNKKDIETISLLADLSWEIASKKKAETVLRKSEETLKIAQRIAHLGSWSMDLATNEVTWSEVLYKIYGFDPTKPPPLYTESMKLFTPESWEKLSSNIAQTSQTGIPYELELETINKKGKHGWMWARGELVRDNNGKPIRMQGVVMDITERKQAEEKIRESEQKFRAMTDNSPLAIYMSSGIEQKAEYMNSTFTRLFGYTLDEVPSAKEWWPLAYPDEQYRLKVEQEWQRKVEKAINTNSEIEPMETVVRCKDGTNRTILWGFISTGQQNWAFGQDLTELKQAEEMVRHLNSDLEKKIAERTAQLEAANKELEAFSYSVSHDLRAPLRAIDGFSKILEEDYNDKLDKEGKHIINVVRESTRQMDQLINDILQFSRSSRHKLELSDIDMSELVRQVYDEQKSTAGHELKIQIHKLPECKADPALIRQVFANLLSNAIKFTRNIKDARIEVGSYNVEKETVYYVKDNGAGFDMKYISKLFGVFQRLHNETEFEGTGIGLALVKQIIARHGGKVWAEGQVNKGATIYFTLPVIKE